MKKRIFRTLYLMSFLGVLLAGVTTMYFSVRFNMNQIEQDLQEMAQTAADSYDKVQSVDGIEFMLDSLPGTIRATIIDKDGTVLYESYANASQMENHLDRPEIQNAMNKGSGEASRKSTTLDVSTYYYAIKLTDGSVLRLAREYSSMYRVILPSTLTLILIVIVLMAAAILFSRRLTVWLIRPVVHLADHIGNLEDAEVYDELEPFIQHIREQSYEINAKEDILKKEQEIMNLVSRNMREGMVLISGDKNIESINSSAIEMLYNSGAQEEFFIGRSIALLNRTETWLTCIKTALNGENAQSEMNNKGRVYNLFASPIVHEGAPDGAVVIILDVTQQRLAEKVRQEFSANVSHELKTPLTSISGYAEMMELDMVRGKDDRIEFARRIHKEALRLIALINDIIRLSRIEDGAPQEFTPVSLPDLCREAVESLQPVAQSAEVTIEVSGVPGVVSGEESMLTEVVYNLCENAIKYNKKGGHVWISNGEQGDEKYIEVRDDGIGIPEESITRVCERFYRVDKSRSKQTGGTGLGLSIVKHIVEYHNGRIEIRSELGFGTSIRIYLPS